MKKSFNVNLAGRIFQIDEDAYEQLNDYFVSIRTCFMNNECGEEIASDIEARMGELFEARVGGDGLRIITLPLVNEMIARVGKPETIVEEEAESSATDAVDPASNVGDEKKRDSESTTHDYISQMSMGKKLFRDGDNKLLGGVVSGLAAYSGINITLLRIITVILFFVTTFWAFLIYLVMWAVIPLAVTTTDKLRMQGVEPTPENIAEKMAYEEPAIDKILRNLKEVDNGGITTLLVILGCVLLLSTFIIGITNSPIYGTFRMLPIVFVLCWIGVISIVAIPVIAVVLVLSKQWAAVSASVKWLLLIDWILALIQVFVIMSSVGIGYFTII